tara:strand:- start:104 stop:754 length:651 start_codon:yes stop_codon:yes gene_type:complete
MNHRTLVLAISGLLLAAFAAAAFFQLRDIPPPQQAALAPTDRSALVRFHSPVFGPANAPVTIVEFFDPSCEACRAFYPVVKQILAENPGDVRLVIRYTLFHQGSEEVSRMLEAARRQNVFPQVLEAVLAAQPAWHDDPSVAKAWEAAAAAGLDVDQARADMYSPGIDAVLKTDMQDVETLGVQRTPTFFVNGQPLTEFGVEQLRQLVRSEIAKAKN